VLSYPAPLRLVALAVRVRRMNVRPRNLHPERIQPLPRRSAILTPPVLQIPMLRLGLEDFRPLL
jgi:hypothetical protein